MRNNDNADRLADEESIRTRTALFHKYVYPHRNLIYHLCIKNTRDRDSVDDNYNEVLVNFFKYIATYDPAREVKTWIYAVTVRMLADLEEKNNRYRREGDVGATDMEGLEGSLPPQDGFGAQEMTLENYRDLYSDEVLAALDSLKPMYRDALLLQVCGYKLEEIMDILHKQGSLKARNIETTKSRIFLAKKKLKEMLTRDGKRRDVQNGEVIHLFVETGG